MNVCLINDSFPPMIDGVANTVLNYAEIINNKYGNAMVATPQYPEVADDYPFEVYRYPSIDTTKIAGYRAGYPFTPETVGELAAHHIDIIHSHCPVSSTMLARLLREQVNAPVIMTYHTKFDIDIARALKGKLIQETATKLLVLNVEACDEVWVVSRGAGENLKSLGYTGDYIVMENGVDLPRGALSQNEVDEITAPAELKGFVFLFVGRMMWYKGLRLILDSLAMLKDKGINFTMVFIGDGADRQEAEDYAESLGLKDHCRFMGAISQRQALRGWYSRADLLLFPSTFDTNGLVVREAAACGLASVMIDGSCAAEGITDGRNGVLIENSPGSMTAALEKLCCEPDAMKQLGQRAMEEIYVSWDDSVSHAWERYQTVRENWKSGGYAHKERLSDDLFNFSGELLDTMDKIHQNGMAKREKLKNLRLQIHDHIDRYL